MRKIFLFLLVVCISKAYGQSKSYDYCYTNPKGTCVYSVADKTEMEVVKGVSDPCLSPDGTKLAYTANTKGGGRILKVIDINTKVKTILNTQSNNCYGAVWSPDGKYIAYNVFDVAKSKWLIAVIDAANTMTPVVVSGQVGEGFMPTWLADSKSVVVQNMDNLFVVDLSGNINVTYKISDIARGAPGLDGTVSASSADRFVFTNNGSKIAFSSEVNEPGGDDGPPNGVFVYDIASKSTLRLSPKGYFAGGVFVKGDKVLFTASKIKSDLSNVYTVDLDGKNLKILFPGCGDISAKN